MLSNLRFEVVDSAPGAAMAGEGPVLAHSNYLRGGKSKWVTNVPQFGSVRVRGVRPGMDLLWYADNNNFEYDLIVKPGTSPDDIHLKFTGSDSLHLDSDGNLIVATRAGEVIQHQPRVWQSIGGGKKTVTGEYRISAQGLVSFAIGPYDKTCDLIIDPVITYSTYLGGSLGDQANGIAVDSSGNAYITGQTASLDFPATVGSYSTSEKGDSTDVFVSKLNPAGTGLVYSTYIGGGATDIANAIAVDSQGNAYITGNTSSGDYPVTTGAFQTTRNSSSSSTDAFFTKLNPAGTALVYSTFLGGSSGQSGNAIQISASGNAYVTGVTTSHDFPTTGNAFQASFPSAGTSQPQVGFVAELNAAGSQLVFSTYLASAGFTTAASLALDSGLNVYVAGSTNYAVPVTTGAYQTSRATNSNTSGFISKLSADGTKLTSSTYLSGPGFSTVISENGISGIALDSQNNVYVTGYTGSQSFPTTSGAFLSTVSLNAVTHAFVSKFTSDLSGLAYSTYLAGSSSDFANAIAVDGAGTAFVAGNTVSADFPLTPGSLFAKKNGGAAGFLTQVNASGSALIYSTLLGGTGTENISSLSLGTNSGLYLSGSTTSTDFPATTGAYQATSMDAGTNNAFAVKLDLSTTVSCTLTISPTTYAASAGDSTSSFTVTTPSACPWVAYSTGFATLTGATHGFGNGVVNFTVPSNASSPATRTAKIFVGSATFTVSQDAGSCSAPQFSPASGSATSSGGLMRVSVGVVAGCNFTATPTVPWVTVTAGSPGTGSGFVSYNVDRNDFGTRTGGIVISGATFPITQAGAGCTSTAVASSGTSPAGGTGVITLSTSAATCYWTAVSQAPWISLNSTSGLGSAWVGFVLAPNPGVVPRTGQVLIASQLVPVTQAAGPSGTPAFYTIRTLAGTGVASFSGDGGPALSAGISNATGLAFDSGGSLLIADRGNNRVRKVASNGIITTIAGTGEVSEFGSGVNATAAGFYQPAGVAAGSNGDIFVGDQVPGNPTVRKITSGLVTTLQKLPQSFNFLALSADLSGNVYAGGTGQIQKISAGNVISVLAGSLSNPTPGGGDGGSAISATLGAVNGLALDAASNLYLTDGNAIRRINGGVINTVAGKSSSGFADGPIASALLNLPNGLAVDGSGNVLIADSGNNRIRRLSPDGKVSTIAGNGTNSSSIGTGEGGAALSASFSGLQGLAIDGSGNIAVGDSNGAIVRLLSPSANPFCTFSLSVTSAAAPASGTQLIPAVTTTAGCAWNSISTVDWISPVTTFGIGAGSAGVQISPNSTGFARAASVSIAGQSFTVTQAATAASQVISFGTLLNATLNSATVALTATASSGLPVSYASNTLSVCTVNGSSVTLLVAGTCSVSASQAGSANFSAAPVVTQAFTVQSGLRFVAITPCRAVDTRNTAGAFGAPGLAGGASRDFAIPASPCGVPANALAYSLNVAVVPTQGPLGYLTVWPAGQAQPSTATLNSDGRVKSNAAIVAAGASGAISVFASNSAHVILDVNGYFVAASNSTALAFYPIAPCRIGDTRNANGPLGGPYLAGGSSRTLPVLASACGLPASAQAYSLNFAAVPRGALGYLTAYPTGQSVPAVASLNAPTGLVTSNAAIVPAGTGGSVDIFASNDTDLVTDVNGYFAPAAAGGLSLYSLTPCRVLDTRLPAGSTPFAGTLAVAVQSTGCGAASGANAYVFNATVVPPASLGYLTLWASGAAQPFVASLNAVDGAVTGNLAIVPAAGGAISAYASNATHLVLDLFAYFAP